MTVKSQWILRLAQISSRQCVGVARMEICKFGEEEVVVQVLVQEVPL
jgi:hypothetical protein